MSKKDMSLGEEFEDFLSFTIKYNVKPQKTNTKQIVKRTRKELQEVANELGLPIEDIEVDKDWCRQGGRYYDELFVNLIAPLYRPAPKWKIVWNEEFRQHIAVLSDQ